MNASSSVTGCGGEAPAILDAHITDTWRLSGSELRKAFTLHRARFCETVGVLPLSSYRHSRHLQDKTLLSEGRYCPVTIGWNSSK